MIRFRAVPRRGRGPHVARSRRPVPANQALEPLEARLLLSNTIPINPSTWTSLGPAPIVDGETGVPGAKVPVAGRISAVAADPSDPATIYIGASGGGVWKTTDGGKDWTPLTDDQDSLNMGALAIAPSNPQVIYAGTGDSNNDFNTFNSLLASTDFYGRGLLVSNDGGASWASIGQAVFDRHSIAKIVVDPTNPNTIYVADGQPGIGDVNGGAGIWKSTDGGQNWLNTTSAFGGNEWYTGLAVDPSNPQVLYMAIGTMHADPTTFLPAPGSAVNGVYRSVNGGGTWQRAGDFPTGVADGKIELALAPSDPNRLYASIVDPNTLGLLQMLRSDDGGQNWAVLANTPNFLGGQGDYNSALAVDPTDPDTIYAAGQYDFAQGANMVVVSHDAGSNWSDLTTINGPETNAHAMAFTADGKLLVGNDGGIWRLDDPSVNDPAWADINGDLAITNFYSVALDPSDPNIAYGGAQGNGTSKFDDALGWHQVFGNNGGVVRVDPRRPSTVYTFVPNFGLERSDDGGNTWTDITAGLAANSLEFSPPFVLDPGTPGRILWGGDLLNESTDRGLTWTQINNPGSNGWLIDAPITAIAIAPSDPNTVYAAAGGHIYMTSDDGGSWADVSIPGANDRISDLQVDSNDPTIVYAVRGVFDDATHTGHVFRSQDGGLTWANITGDLPDLPAFSLAVDATADYTALFLGTGEGLFASYDGGQSWQKFRPGLPNAVVTQVVWNSRLQILAVATHGRGLFETKGDNPIDVLLQPPTDVDEGVPIGTKLAPVPVARFLDYSGLSGQKAYTATIDWGNGQKDDGTVVPDGQGGYLVEGTTTYGEGGSYTLKVTVGIVGLAPVTAQGTIVVRDAPLNATSAGTINTVEGAAGNFVFGTFVDTDLNPTRASDYTVTVDFGDGTPTADGDLTLLPDGVTWQVSAPHTYNDEKLAPGYTYNVQIVDRGGATATLTGPVIVADAPLTGRPLGFAPVEGQAATNVAVAHFDDGNPNATLADFTATIVWGDGHITPGQVALDPLGGFLVKGTNRYAEEGTYPNFSVTVHDKGGESLTLTQTVIVTDAPLTAQGTSFGIVEGASFNGVVATFIDANPAGKLADFKARIDWGDGSPIDDATVVANSSGGFRVLGTHVFDEGVFTLKITITDVGGATTSTTSTATIADAPITAQTAALILATEGKPFTGTIATFTDANPQGKASDFTASIIWGDGSPTDTTATIVADPSGGFDVVGAHTFEEGTYTVKVTINDKGGQTTSISTTATIADAPLHPGGQAQQVNVVEGQAVGGVLAVFTDENPLAKATDFTATIAWGDGSTTPGTVAAAIGGGFTVVDAAGSHTFEEGTYPIQVTIRDVGGQTLVMSNITVVVTDAPLTAAGVDLNPGEGFRFSSVVATFTDANPKAPLSDFSASIDWGDGTTSVASILAVPTGGFEVRGSHAYSFGNYTITTTIRDVGGQSASATSHATVPDAPLSSAGLPVAALVEGRSLTDPVASFSDADPQAKPSTYTVTIDWGDGSTTPGTIAPGPGGYTIAGNHIYNVGTYTITARVSDAGGSTTSATTRVVVNDAPLSAAGTSLQTIEGVPLRGTVATFVDEDTRATPANFDVTIDWGGGHVTAGTVVPDGGGRFHVDGAFAFADEGTFPVVVTINDHGGSVAKATATAVVADAPIHAGAAAIAPTAKVPFTTLVALFNDENTAAPASDFNATVNWGDGSATPGQVVAVPGKPGLFAVMGSHTYAEPVAVGLIVQVKDQGGSIGSASTIVAVAPHAVPIVGALDAASDTGASSSDGITRLNTPSFHGTAEAGDTLVLYGIRAGTTAPFEIGRTTVGADGAWSLTTAPLMDGVYTVVAVATDAAGYAGTPPTALMPAAGHGPLVIDTAGPHVVGVTLDLNGQVKVALQDVGLGLDQAGLLNPANYSLAPGGGGGLTPSSLSATAFALGAPQIVTAGFGNVGLASRSGSYVLTINAAGVTDLAGNPLDERFFTLNVPAGQAGPAYVAQLTSSGVGATDPQKVGSTASRPFRRQRPALGLQFRSRFRG